MTMTPKRSRRPFTTKCSREGPLARPCSPRKEKENPGDIWNRLVRADIELLRLLVDDDLADGKGRSLDEWRKRIVNAYRKEFASGVTPKDIKSALGQFNFLIAMLNNSEQSARQELGEMLKTIRQELKA
jgi:hypothetical protein